MQRWRCFLWGRVHKLPTRSTDVKNNVKLTDMKNNKGTKSDRGSELSSADPKQRKPTCNDDSDTAEHTTAVPVELAVLVDLWFLSRGRKAWKIIILKAESLTSRLWRGSTEFSIFFCFSEDCFKSSLVNLKILPRQQAIFRAWRIHVTRVWSIKEAGGVTALSVWKGGQPVFFASPSSQTRRRIWLVSQEVFYSLVPSHLPEISRVVNVLRVGLELCDTASPCPQVLPIYFKFLAVPWGMWDPSSLTRHWTWAPVLGHGVLTTGPPASPHVPNSHEVRVLACQKRAANAF